MPEISAVTRTVSLAAEDDLPGFRRAARRLVAEGVVPEDVSWFVRSTAEADLFDTGRGVDGAVDPAPALMLPAFFAAGCQHAGLHADPGRFGLLYRLLWRLVHEPGLRHDPLDADRVAMEQMARAVRRDQHKMTAFVRFRPLAVPADEGEGAAETIHVAWFEPQHHTLRATAPFFARRFAQMAWAILTPERSARWDGRRLSFGPGARREDAPAADAGEQLWLTYYENIFNPARLKLKMMQKEMPRFYWKNLPEAALIQPLTALSAERSGRMVEQAASEPVRRRSAASLALRIEPAAMGVVGAATSLEDLRTATERCRACPIGHAATQAVPGEGPVGARLMFVGEQPGDQEDLHGRPFVGPAGQLLARAMAELGVERASVYLTNAVRHFKFEPRGKRRIHKTPAQQEAAACAHWLEEEIAMVQPGALVALGATAARSLLGRPVAVTAERGRWLGRADGRQVLVTLHPAALLRMAPHQFDAAFAAWLADLRLAFEGSAALA
ncbi:uracil-DNA glycosylase [Rhodoferax koreense]|uniref:Type-4 uracil-DNA glycosylase n=1 Tax=Rhodoferax koreensis TaxID=1842727 RepID=A0A1P8JRA4_9BURK|nr:UdgX family uracil-DNA binding protein [Rhodoferax koreense]APW36269.1 uracil-DNA glycosylase [Rhodoferax koreense]